MPSFKEYQSKNLAPGFLRDPVGTAYLEGFGERKDAAAQALKDAVKARMPSLAPLDALAALARERGIMRGQTETEASHRARVRAAWDSWRWAGTPWGLLMAFWHAGYTPSSGRVVLQTQNGRQYALREDFDPAVHGPENGIVYADLGTVHLGGSPELWSQLAVLFVPPVPPTWIPTPPADGSPEVDAIRALITAWKPAHIACVKLQATTVELWEQPQEPYEPTTEVWDEAGGITTWTPPAG